MQGRWWTGWGRSLPANLKRSWLHSEWYETEKVRAVFFGFPCDLEKRGERSRCNREKHHRDRGGRRKVNPKTIGKKTGQNNSGRERCEIRAAPTKSIRQRTQSRNC